MKRELIAGGVLLLLAIGSWINLIYLRGFTGGLTETLELSRAYCESGQYELAEAELEKASDAWLPTATRIFSSGTRRLTARRTLFLS